MADKKVISIRFHNSSDEDMELYEKLENEALNGGSLASVAKARIKLSYENANDSDLKEQIVEIIQKKKKKSSMKIVGALLAGVNGGVSTENIVESQSGNDTQLPEQSADLPSGALDFLG